MVSLQTSERLAGQLVSALADCRGLNEFFETTMPLLARSFDAEKTLLIDYKETTGHFDLIHFYGYPKQARFELQRNVADMKPQRALTERQPYFAADREDRLFLPLYFSTTLEALIVFEASRRIDLTPERRHLAQIVSKFIGLLMSSGRLSINRGGLVDMNDLQRARQIQLTYLPAENLQTERYEVYGYNRSSALVGGDYFDYFCLRNHSIQCVLADASGHGLSAALIMSTFRALLHSEIDQFQDCAKLFATLNRNVHSGSTVVQYLTAVFLDFDEGTYNLRHTNAGHFDPSLIREDGKVERLIGGGPPLGMFGNSEYPVGVTKIEAGDLLVMFTDGFTDLRNSADEFFGEERILECVREHRTRPLKEIASVLLNEGMTFSATPQAEDDLTLFLLRFH